ncbi:MAG: hypothetical protein ACLQVN_21000 [Bryobacteraceae bacterium]
MHTYAAVEQRDDLIQIERAAPATGRTPDSRAGSSLAEFWENRGLRVCEKDGVFWGEYKGGFFTSLPFQLHLDAGAGEVRSILGATRARGLRFPSTNLPGLASGIYVCRPAAYDLQSVSRKQRGHVTHGMDVCEFRDVEADELLREGMALNRDTLERQRREDARFLDPAHWAGFVDAARRSAGVAVHGAYIGGRLSAYMVSCRDGGWLHLMFKMSRAADLEHYPNHALDYWVLRQAAGDARIEYVGNGFASLMGNEGLDRYKRQMGYQLQPHNLCLHLTPAAAPWLANRVTVSMARAVASRLPNHSGAAYAAAILEGVRQTRTKPAEAATQAGSDDMCQQEEAVGFSRILRPAAAFPLLRAWQTLRKGGVRYMWRRGADYLRRKTRKRRAGPAAVRPLGPEEVLNLQPGDWVEVKSMEEIRATLDARGKNRGLLFTDDMRGFAGKRYRVFKRVESIFLEESKQRRTLKNTVLLEAVYCPGVTFRCDRSCFLFWKEAWLRRTSADGTE